MKKLSFYPVVYYWPLIIVIVILLGMVVWNSRDINRLEKQAQRHQDCWELQLKINIGIAADMLKMQGIDIVVDTVSTEDKRMQYKKYGI